MFKSSLNLFKIKTNKVNTVEYKQVKIIIKVHFRDLELNLINNNNNKMDDFINII
jgi:hypothetical protein